MENGEGQPRNNQERQFMDQKRQEVRDDVVRNQAGQVDEQQTAINLRQRVEQIAQQAADAEQNVQANQFNGEAQQPNTPRNNEVVTNITVQEVLRQYKTNPNFFRNALPANSMGGLVLQSLTTLIDNPQQEISLKEAPYIYKIINQAIHNQIADPLTVLNNRELGNLFAQDPGLYNKIVTTLMTAAQNGGIPAEEIERFAEREERRVQERGRGSYDSSPQILRAKLAAEDPNLALLYDALGSPQEFVRYYQQRINAMGNDPQASRRFSQDFVENVTRLVNIIYKPVLTNAKPEEGFEQLENKGSFYSNPGVLYHSGLIQRIDDLNSMVNQMGRNMPQLEVFELGRENRLTYDERSKSIQRRDIPGSIYEQCKLDKFTQFLKEVAETEKSLLQYGFNFGYLLQHGPDPEKGFFPLVAGYAKNLPADYIDMMAALPNFDLVQAAMLSMEPMYKKFFAIEAHWKKEPNLMERFFIYQTAQENSAKEQLLRDFPNTPRWGFDRSMLMAKTILFGMNFKFNEFASFLDPSLRGEEQGPSYLSEGAMTGYFNPESLSMRWLSKNSTIGQSSFLPFDGPVIGYDHVKLPKEGKDIWGKMFKEGQSAKLGGSYEGKMAKDPASGGTKMFAEIGNITGSGGVDTLGGWREIYGYLPWLEEEIKPESKDFYFDRNDVLVKGWKKVENIGWNILRNYVDQLVLPGGSEFAVLDPAKMTGEKLTRFEELFRFLYQRYLDTDLGRSFITRNGQVIGEDAYWQDINDILQSKDHFKIKGNKLRSKVYQALTVVMFERLPLDFMLMQKTRHSQNGVTILSQMENFFVGQGQGQPHWSIEGQFYQAVDDMIFVQQQARMETIRRMREFKENQQNIYGNIGGLRSEVMMDAQNQAKGYVIDDDYINQVLTRQYPQDPERVARVRDFYRKLKEYTINPPSENTTATASWRGIANDRTKSKKEREIARAKLAFTNYATNMEWWSKALENNLFGFSLASSEKAHEFIKFAASGPETIQRAANVCAANAEQLFNKYNKELLPALWKATQEKKYDGLVDWLFTIRQAVENDFGEEKAYEVSARYAQRIIYYFRKDDAANVPGKDVLDWINKTKASIAAEFAGPRRPTWQWDKDVTYGFVTALEGKNIVPVDTKLGNIKYVDLRASQLYGGLGRLAERVWGKPIYIKRRDWANEFSGGALRNENVSGLLNIVSTRMLGLLLLLLILYAKLASDKNKQK